MYGSAPAAAVCMRKHLLWYTKGWPGGKKVRELINSCDSLASCHQIITDFYHHLIETDQFYRICPGSMDSGGRFTWDPKWDMDRRLDRGIGDDGLA